MSDNKKKLHKSRKNNHDLSKFKINGDFKKALDQYTKTTDDSIEASSLIIEKLLLDNSELKKNIGSHILELLKEVRQYENDTAIKLKELEIRDSNNRLKIAELELEVLKLKQKNDD